MENRGIRLSLRDAPIARSLVQEAPIGAGQRRTVPVWVLIGCSAKIVYRVDDLG